MFKVVPEFPNLSCDEKGRISTNYIDTKNKYSEYINYKGYLISRIKTNGKSFIRMKHRVIASTWLPNFKKTNDVNHIDGNKENNNIENLESVTHKKNMEHASKNNLIKNQHNISLCTENGLYNKFVSLKSLAKFLGVNSLSLVNKIKYSKKFNIIKKVKNKNVHFYILLDNINGLKKTTNSGKKSIKYYVYDIVHNKKYVFDTLIECSYETTINPSSLVVLLKDKEYFINTYLGYIVSTYDINFSEIMFKKIDEKTRLNNIKIKFDHFNTYLSKI